MKRWKYDKIGVDMSRALRTIRRPVLMELLKKTGCTEDVISIVNMLLTNTALIVNIKTQSGRFAITLRSFQGERLSGNLFTLYFTGALNHISVISKRDSPPITEMTFPMEMKYPNYIDFPGEEAEN